MFRVADLDNLCNTHTQPVKLRKLTPSTSVPVTAKPTQEQLIIQVWCILVIVKYVIIFLKWQYLYLKRINTGSHMGFHYIAANNNIVFSTRIRHNILENPSLTTNPKKLQENNFELLYYRIHPLQCTLYVHNIFIYIIFRHTQACLNC